MEKYCTCHGDHNGMSLNTVFHSVRDLTNEWVAVIQSRLDFYIEVTPLLLIWNCINLKESSFMKKCILESQHVYLLIIDRIGNKKSKSE